MTRRSHLLARFLLLAAVATTGCGDRATDPSAQVPGNPGAVPAAQPGDPDRFRIPVAGTEPARGADEPLVTIVEFSDFQIFNTNFNHSLPQPLPPN